MWEVTSCQVKFKDEVDTYLFRGYEPFAITNDYGYDRIWFRKELTSAEEEEIKERRASNAVHNKSAKRKQGRSTRSSV